MKFRLYLKLVRAYQWVKNLFLFMPIFFSGNLLNSEMLFNVLFGFLAFSFTSSIVYIMNDLVDKKADMNHPIKKNRPIASNLVSNMEVFIVLCFLLIGIIFFSIRLNPIFVYLLGFYFTQNVLYSFYLKKIAIIDVFVISFGFLLRVYSGGAIINVHISKWLALMTFLISMLMALAKRRDDVLLIDKNDNNIRESLNGYNLEFINFSMIIMLCITTISYIMYTVSDDVIKRIGNDYVYVTSFIVLLGLLRYLQLTIVYNNSSSPTKILLNDKFIQFTLILWVLVFFIFIYLDKIILWI